MINRIRTIIVDDEPPARLLIRTLLSELNDIEIVGECSNGKTALNLIHKEKPDLIFLDVQMPGMSGVEMLTRLDPQLMPYVVFVTAFDHYAVRAFELEAIDFVVKPVERDRLIESLSRARRETARDQQTSFVTKITALAQQLDPSGGLNKTFNKELHSRFLTSVRVNEGRRIRDLPTNEIICIKAADQYIEIHTTSGTFLLLKSLKDIESDLDPKKFIRIHRSSLVNTKFVSEVRTAKYGTHIVILTNGETLNVSRNYRNKVTLLLNNLP